MGVSYENIDIEEQNISRDNLVAITGGYTVPQIVINDISIGGFTELIQLDQSGKLKGMINNE